MENTWHGLCSVRVERRYIRTHMKAAFSSWNNRIAPVFDVARQIFLVESDQGRILREAEEVMPGDDPGEKARCLADLGANTLVCGAISRSMQGLITSCGITVIPFVAGELQEVVRAWLEGKILEEFFAMPGCCPQAGRRGGMGRGMREGRNRCSRGVPLKGESGLICVCQNCSYSEPHERGVPCSLKRCPVCGCSLIRGQQMMGMLIKEDQRP